MHRTKKNIFLLLANLLVLVCAYSQPPETIIKIQAMDMARAVLAKDVDKIVYYMPPKLVADAGGKEKMMIARDTVNKYMKQFGAEIKKVTIGNPGKIISYKKQLQTTVPQTTEASFMSSTVILQSTLIAISEDGGRRWYFVDTNIYRENKLRSSLPDLSPDLVIPSMTMPKIIPNQ